MTRVSLFRCRLAHDSIVVDVAPRVAQDYEPQNLRISFKRMIRVPDNAEKAALPPDIGNFPLFKVSDFASNLPLPMARKGGVFFPMYQREAMWINFSAKRPFMIKIYAGGVNVVSGEHSVETEETMRRRRDLAAKKKNTQDYVVVPGQRWLDGFAVSPGVVRQFVAMPMGSGYSVEAQLTGQEVLGGLQFEITPSMPVKLHGPSLSTPFGDFIIVAKTLTGKTIPIACSPADTIASVKNAFQQAEGIPPDQQRLVFGDKLLDNNWTLRDCGVQHNSIVHFVLKLRGGGTIDGYKQFMKESMGIATGGKIKQVIHNDAIVPTIWAKCSTITIPVHVLTTALFCDATGHSAPPCPISVSDYAAAGLPFFNLPETPSGIAGGFEQVKSVGALRVDQGLAHDEEPDVKPRVVKIPTREKGGGPKNWVDAATIEDPDGLVSRDGPLRAFRTLSILKEEVKGNGRPADTGLGRFS